VTEVTEEALDEIAERLTGTIREFGPDAWA